MRDRGERRGEHHVLAAPLEVARVVEGAALRLGQRLEAGARDLEHRPLDERGCDAGFVAVAPLELELGPLRHGASRHARDLHRHLHTPVVAARQVEHSRAHRHGLVEQRAQHALLHDGEPPIADDEAGEREQPGQSRKAHGVPAPADDQRGGDDRSRQRDRKQGDRQRPLCQAETQPSRVCGEGDMGGCEAGHLSCRKAVPGPSGSLVPRRRRAAEVRGAARPSRPRGPAAVTGSRSP